MDDIRLVACDLDGTLLQDGRRLPTQRQFELIGQLADRGIGFFAASGRQYASLERLFEPVRDKIGYVCENGALVKYRGETLVCREMPHDLARRVCRAVMDYEGAGLFVSCPSMGYVPEGNPAFLDEVKNVYHNTVTTFRDPDELKEPIIKIAFELDHDRLPAASAHFTRLFSDHFRVVTSGFTWLDFLAPGINKGTALAAAGERLGVGLAQMAAFGDEENDREMLEAVGHPYLMQTCNPSMRDVAPGRVCLVPTVEDELARWL